MPNRLELMEMRAKALFIHDENGLIKNINDPDKAPAPRFFLGCTPDGNVLRFRYDLPQRIIRKLTDLITAEPIRYDLQKNPALLEKITWILQDHQEITEVSEGPAYKLPGGIIFPSDVIKMTDNNVRLLAGSFDYMVSELQFWEPCFVKFVNGNVTSICFSSRISSMANEAGVETLPRFRGNGYAVEVAAAWAAAVYETNRIPLYSTSWENTASQSVARKLNGELFGIDLSIY